MTDKQATANRSWWARYRKWLLWLVIIWAVAMLVLYFVSGLSQDQPVKYQLF